MQIYLPLAGQMIQIDTPMNYEPFTLPKTNSSPLKMDGWKTIVSFSGPALFLGAFAVRFREGILHQASEGSERNLMALLGREGTPVSFRGGTPVSFREGTPVSFRGGTPVGFRGGTPVSFRGGTPVSFRGGTSASFREGTPVSFRGGNPVSFRGGTTVISFREGTPVSFWGGYLLNQHFSASWGSKKIP